MARKKWYMSKIYMLKQLQLAEQAADPIKIKKYKNALNWYMRTIEKAACKYF